MKCLVAIMMLFLSLTTFAGSRPSPLLTKREFNANNPGDRLYVSAKGTRPEIKSIVDWTKPTYSIDSYYTEFTGFSGSSNNPILVYERHYDPRSHQLEVEGTRVLYGPTKIYRRPGTYISFRAYSNSSNVVRITESGVGSAGPLILDKAAFNAGNVNKHAYVGPSDILPGRSSLEKWSRPTYCSRAASSLITGFAHDLDVPYNIYERHYDPITRKVSFDAKRIIYSPSLVYRPAGTYVSYKAEGDSLRDIEFHPWGDDSDVQ